MFQFLLVQAGTEGMFRMENIRVEAKERVLVFESSKPLTRSMKPERHGTQREPYWSRLDTTPGRAKKES